jgi:hypothetical protein
MATILFLGLVLVSFIYSHYSIQKKILSIQLELNKYSDYKNEISGCTELLRVDQVRINARISELRARTDTIQDNIKNHEDSLSNLSLEHGKLTTLLKNIKRNSKKN